MMSSILDLLRDHKVRTFEPGQIVLRQGEKTDCLYFLIEGAVDVLKDDVPVASATQPGAVFGELAFLLHTHHTATVRVSKRSAFYIVENPRELLSSCPPVCVHICELLARRLDAMNQYLVDVKAQFEGHDHIGMVDKVLEALLHRTPRERVRPKASTFDQGELTD